MANRLHQDNALLGEGVAYNATVRLGARARSIDGPDDAQCIAVATARCDMPDARASCVQYLGAVPVSDTERPSHLENVMLQLKVRGAAAHTVAFRAAGPGGLQLMASGRTPDCGI